MPLIPPSYRKSDKGKAFSSDRKWDIDLQDIELIWANSKGKVAKQYNIIKKQRSAYIPHTHFSGDRCVFISFSYKIVINTLKKTFNLLP